MRQFFFAPNTWEENAALILWQHVFSPVTSTGCFGSVTIRTQIFFGSVVMRHYPSDINRVIVMTHGFNQCRIGALFVRQRFIFCIKIARIVLFYFAHKLEQYNTSNLYTKYKSLSDEERTNPALIEAMRHYDYTVNITWVMAHYHAAEKYLRSDGNTTEATGGSDWRKYMLPKYQRRIFFPSVWSEEELAHWGVAESPNL